MSCPNRWKRTDKQLRIPRDSSYPDTHGGVLERSFAEQIRTGRPDYTNVRESIEGLRVIHAAMESYRTGQTVSCYPPAQKV